ncbi:hypothetical protein K3495_g6837 [Podosphaera aphanis]|nr:hypothetical protein K3495_g6837 [Podosphaera aphanis]
MTAARTKRASHADRRGGQKTLSFHGSRITKPTARSLLAEKSRSTLAGPVTTPREAVPRRTPTLDEQRASRVTAADLRRFLRRWESQRQALAVHQDGLDMHAKILRCFDTNSQFGPCIGISRSKRWIRAQRLGLSPPIEVLAILSKASPNKCDQQVERAYIDELMNT